MLNPHNKDKNTAISPEISLLKRNSSNLIFKISWYFFKPFYIRAKFYFDCLKFSHHKDNRFFNWDWSKINYNRIAVVNKLLSKFENPFYLEIGCAGNDLFNSLPIPNKTGVDPSSGGTIRKTSDEFFRSNNTKYDVIFIDGLHTYEQVRRDVINSINSLNKGGWIAIHDMLPRDWIEHHVPVISKGTWTGDVWKVGFELTKTHGIDFKILKIDHGIGLIKKTHDQVYLEDFRVNLLNKEFDYFFENINKLPILEWDIAQNWINS
jgi:hypothetical protein